MVRPLILCCILLSCISGSTYCQTQKDSFEVNTVNYKGYIMPLGSYPEAVAYEIEYLPSLSEVKMAEEYLATYLKSYCANCQYHIDSVDCKAVKKELKKYFRQYRSYTSTNRTMYILFISPRLQVSHDKMKKQWQFNDNEKGPALFVAVIDLDTGEVWFRDNG